jgi:signal transduction histidine kinase
VLDEGREPPAASSNSRHGNGIIGMRERVNLLGGAIDVEHFSGVGFSVRAHLPITERLSIEGGVSRASACCSSMIRRWSGPGSG